MKAIPRRLADRLWFGRWQARGQFRRRVATIEGRTIVGPSGSSYITRINNATISGVGSSKGEFSPGDRVFVDSSKDGTIDSIRGPVPPEETTTQTADGSDITVTNITSLL